MILAIAVLDYYWFLKGTRACFGQMCAVFTLAVIAVSVLSIFFALVMLYTELSVSGKEDKETGKYSRKQMEKLYERLKNSE